MTVARIIAGRELDWAQNVLPWCTRQELPHDGEFLGDGPIVDALDYRVQMLAERVELRDKRVLEVGSCDGCCTVGLCVLNARVVAIDARLPNALKTLAKVSLSGFVAEVYCFHAEQAEQLGEFDAVFHCGVLYHLERPVDHLLMLGRVSDTVLLDTHTAKPNEELIAIDGYQGHWWQEAADLWSGMQSRSFWLTEESLRQAVKEAGFSSMETLRTIDDNPCGPRAIYLLRKQ